MWLIRCLLQLQTASFPIGEPICVGYDDPRNNPPGLPAPSEAGTLPVPSESPGGKRPNACKVNGKAGTCITIANCESTGGQSTAGYCPKDPTGVQVSRTGSVFHVALAYRCDSAAPHRRKKPHPLRQIHARSAAPAVHAFLLRPANPPARNQHRVTALKTLMTSKYFSPILYVLTPQRSNIITVLHQYCLR